MESNISATDSERQAVSLDFMDVVSSQESEDEGISSALRDSP